MKTDYASRIGDAGEAALATVTPILVTALIVSLLRTGVLGRGGFAQSVAALLFLITCTVALRIPTDREPSGRWLSLRRAAREVTVASMVFFVIAMSTKPANWPSVRSNAAALLFAALSEEYVFRRALVSRLNYQIATVVPPRYAAIVAVIFAQLSFGLSHLFRGIPGDIGVVAMDQVRLLAVGVGYWLLVRRFGVGISAGFHAALNFHLLKSLSLEPVVGGLAVLSMVIGMWVLDALVADRCRSAYGLVESRRFMWRTS